VASFYLSEFEKERGGKKKKNLKAFEIRRGKTKKTNLKI
jgi:hypothetical protein